MVLDRGDFLKTLLIEDDRDLCLALSSQLGRENWETECCHRGDEAELYLEKGAYDLVLLDCMLPGLDGRTVLRRMRERGDFTPVIILSALGEVENRVRGLNTGADDYLVKPFAFSELMARVNSLFRRKDDFTAKALSFGDLRLEEERQLLFCEDRSCGLSQTETELMGQLLRSGGQVAARRTLLYRVWGRNTGVEDSNLDNYIYFLRKRLRQLDSRVGIRNLRGSGYYLEEQTPDAPKKGG